MRLVILESPFRGRGKWWFQRWFDQWQNIRYARACVRHSLDSDESPSPSHLVFTQPGIINEADERDRNLGIAAGLEWRKVAEASVVYEDRGITPGMRKGIRLAREAQIPVEFRTLGEKWRIA